MGAVLSALAPVFFIIALGYVAKKRQFPGEGFWIPCEQILFYFLLPCLFFHLTYSAKLPDPALLWVPAAVCTGILVFTFFMLVFRPLFSRDGPTFTSIYQGAVRYNGYVAISAATALYGELGTTITAVTISITVPMLNLLCVGILLAYGKKKGTLTLPQIGKLIISNPLILSCGSGFLLNYVSAPIPAVVVETLSILGRAALPLGLLAVGAGLKMETLRGAKRELILSCGLKLIGLPLFVAMVALAFGLQGDLLYIAILFASLPGPTSSYIMARLMGGNIEIMNAIVVAQTLAAALTIPIVLILSKTYLPLFAG